MRNAVLALILVTIAVTFVSCDSFLTRKPTSALQVEDFYQTPQDAIAATNAVYAIMQHRPFNSNHYWRLAETPSDDDVLFNNFGAQFDDFSWNASALSLDLFWATTYRGVYRANKVLEEVPDIEMNEDLEARLLAEAKFLRALYYWHLTTMWKDVPLLTEAPDTPQEAEVPKSPQSEIYDLMIKDLKQAASVLPRTYPSNQVGRATKGAAQALLGKIYLYAENHPEAEKWFKKVIDSGLYTLNPSFPAVFTTDNGPGSVFEIQYADVGGWTGDADFAGSNEATDRSWYWLPRGGFANVLPTQSLVDEFQEYRGPDPEGVFDGRDPRLYYSIWSQGDYYDEQEPVFQSDWTPTGYAVKKGLVPVQRDDSQVGTNFKLIRYADVLLMYAEAANENGHPQEAIDAINKVRARVGMPTYPNSTSPYSVSASSSQQEIFDAIVHERRVELAFEYHRYNDLRRWGLAQEVLGPLGYTPKHRYFPIPQAELDVNEELEQNPAYL